VPHAYVAREVVPTPATALVDALHDATHAVLARLTPELEAEGLSHCKFWTLYRLAVGGADHPKAIAERLAVTMPSVTSSVDQLVDDRLVERRRSEADRRVVVLEITPKGRQVLANVLRRFDATMSSALRSLPRAQTEAAARTLSELAERLRSRELLVEGRPA
jgi:MarR family transcriptional regulator, organic hydroperoxide resistance regulator